MTSGKQNEWGTPDWRDACAYGDTGKWSRARWRWEFLRRRDDLRKYFDQTLAWELESRAQMMAAGGPTWVDFDGNVHPLDPDMLGWNNPTDAPDFVIFATEHARQKFGYLGIPNPRLGEQPSWAIIEESTAPIGRYLDGARCDNSTHNSFRLPPNEVAIKFRLDAPLEKQFATAREMLEALQRERYGKRAIKRERLEKWLTYLRLLDAEEAGATLTEMSEILPESMGNRSPRAAANVLGQAKKVQFSF